MTVIDMRNTLPKTEQNIKLHLNISIIQLNWNSESKKKTSSRQGHHNWFCRIFLWLMRLRSTLTQDPLPMRSPWVLFVYSRGALQSPAAGRGFHPNICPITVHHTLVAVIQVKGFYKPRNQICKSFRQSFFYWRFTLALTEFSEEKLKEEVQELDGTQRARPQEHAHLSAKRTWMKKKSDVYY